MSTQIFISSRLTSGNMLFPDTVRIEGDALRYRKDSWFSHREETILIGAVASVRAQHGLLFSSLSIESYAGRAAIRVNGLWKDDAQQLQDKLHLVQLSMIRCRNE